MQTNIERGFDAGFAEPTIDCLRYSDFEAALLAELRKFFSWTASGGLVESEGPTLVRCTWNRIALGDKWVD